MGLPLAFSDLVSFRCCSSRAALSAAAFHQHAVDIYRGRRACMLTRSGKNGLGLTRLSCWPLILISQGSQKFRVGSLTSPSTHRPHKPKLLSELLQSAVARIHQNHQILLLPPSLFFSSTHSLSPLSPRALPISSLLLLFSSLYFSCAVPCCPQEWI